MQRDYTTNRNTVFYSFAIHVTHELSKTVNILGAKIQQKYTMYLSSITEQIVNGTFINVMALMATLIHCVASVTYTAVATLKVLTCSIAADWHTQSTLIDIYGREKSHWGSIQCGTSTIIITEECNLPSNKVVFGLTVTFVCNA